MARNRNTNLFGLLDVHRPRRHRGSEYSTFALTTQNYAEARCRAHRFRWHMLLATSPHHTDFGCMGINARKPTCS